MAKLFWFGELKNNLIGIGNMRLEAVLAYVGRFIPSKLPMLRDVSRIVGRNNTKYEKCDYKGNVFILPYRINPGAQWFEFLLSKALEMRGYRVTLGIGEDVSTYTDGYFVSRSRLKSRILSLLRVGQFSRVFDSEILLFSRLLGQGVIEQLRKESRSVELSDIACYEKCGINLGRHVMGSLSRYFLRCEVNLEQNENVVREYLFTALVSLEAAKIVIQLYKPEFVVASHGIYSSWGPFCDYCGSQGVPYTTWGMQYKKHSFVFAHNNNYHKDVIEEDSSWKTYSLDEKKKQDLLDYVNSKFSLKSHSDNINYYSNADKVKDFSRESLGIEGSDTVFGLFPNLAWDAQVSFRPLFFRNMNEWIVETVKWFSKNSSKILIIRAHPAEKLGHVETCEKIEDILNKNFSRLPKNVIFIKPEDKVTSYDVLEVVDACLVYGSKFGLEAALSRKPLIIAGEAYFRGKGMSFDPSSIEEYFSLLDKCPNDTLVNDEMYENAISYGYHYFFRRQVILPLANMDGHQFKKYLMSDIKQMRPGEIPELDDFLDRLISGRRYINPNLG